MPAPVALESTLVAHGLPWPENWQVARDCEAIVRAEGAEPRTVAVLGGLPRVGLGPDELERLARPGVDILKAGRRDLGWIAAQGRDAATTVSATLFLARREGVRVMATGGLGGVHREWARRPDVSADLGELARADGCLVVCSGFKTLLDVAASWEALETLGVAVVGYATDELPGFLARSAGHRLDARVDSPEEAAEIVTAHRRLGLPGAVVLVQTVPTADAVDAGTLERAIAEASAAARTAGIGGKPLTPFLLGRVREFLGPTALRANAALIRANARLAARVATRLGTA